MIVLSDLDKETGQSAGGGLEPGCLTITCPDSVLKENFLVFSEPHFFPRVPEVNTISFASYRSPKLSMKTHGVWERFQLFGEKCTLNARCY